MDRPGEWVTLDEARTRLLDAIDVAAPVTVPIDSAVGLILAAEIVAPHAVPPFAASAMDGFAVRSADTSRPDARLRIVGDVRAGSATRVSVGVGDAVAVATGSPIPDGADAVCPVEEATRSDDQVTIRVACDAGRFVRPAGSDIPAGQPVFSPGTRLRSAHIGVLASLGLAEVRVIPRSRVGVLATGDEVIAAGRPLGPGQIHDANGPALRAACRAAGYEAVDLGIVGDDPDALEAALVDAAATCSIVLTSGGVSVGAADHLKAVLGRLAPATVQWFEVRIKPGKPFGFAVLPGSATPVLCLPGNPVSALVVFEILVSAALARQSGIETTSTALHHATATEAIVRRPDGKTHFLLAVAEVDSDGALRARPAGPQESHQLHTLADANALVVLPDGEGAAAGDRVDVRLLDGEHTGASTR